ncbi:YRB1 [Ecytonucleospora hepatopenaei]|uniref:YRB1 n=1 Tax=Ecytonucleospora hepatopenaei TaxID=646526 RepID=A0A1W0E3R1_9MICR|nr:YRB1 [Ecytonucleospora hepatopenaei]
MCAEKLDLEKEKTAEEIKKQANDTTSPFLVKKESNKETTEKPEKNKEHEEQTKELEQKTGSDAVFLRSCKLYFLMPSTKKLETRGSGHIMILKSKSKLHKLIMIRDGIKLKGADHYISPSSKLVKAVNVEHSYIWVAVDDKSDAEENYKRTTYFATFKNEAEAEEFKKAYEAAQENNLAVFSEIKEQLAKKESEK